MTQLLEIERELNGPDKEDAMRRYDEQLLGLELRLDAMMNEGLSHDDFSQAEQLKKATITARKLLRLTIQKNRIN